MIPNLEQISPDLDASLEDFHDLWPLLDDQETLVAQPESKNVGIYQSHGNISSSPRLQVATSDIGSQLLERQDTSLLPEPSTIGRQGLLFIDAPVGDVLMCGEQNAECPASTSDAGKGKGKAVQTVVSPESGEAEHRLSLRTRIGRRARDRLQTGGEEGPVAKKQDHNAKERVRRMKLNASYLALGALLPQSRRSKVSSSRFDC